MKTTESQFGQNRFEVCTNEEHGVAHLLITTLYPAEISGQVRSHVHVASSEWIKMGNWGLRCVTWLICVIGLWWSLVSLTTEFSDSDQQQNNNP